MNFELGKTYIVNVTEKGIIPSMEFDRSQWFNKDYNDLEFLTDEEKIVIVNDTLDKIRAEIKEKFEGYDICEWFDDYDYEENDISEYRAVGSIDMVLEIIDKYRDSEET